MVRLFLLLLLSLAALRGAEQDLRPKLLYTSYEAIPERIYLGQVFPVKLNALIADEGFEAVKVETFGQENVSLLNEELAWRWFNDNKFTLTLYMKAEDLFIRLPDVNTSIWGEENLTDVSLLPGQKLQVEKVAVNPSFCGVVASHLAVTSHKVEKYDDKRNILAMEIEGKLANLEDFRLPVVGNQDVEEVPTVLPYAKIFYSAIIPAKMEELSFNYFQPETGEFEKVSVRFDLSDLGQKIATHVEINPKKKGISLLALLIILASTLALLLLYWRWRNLGILLVAILLLAGGIFWLLRDEEAIVLPYSDIYVLPTENSTKFHTTGTTTSVVRLKSRNGYVKILLPDNSVGWVRRENVR